MQALPVDRPLCVHGVALRPRGACQQAGQGPPRSRLLAASTPSYGQSVCSLAACVAGAAAAAATSRGGARAAQRRAASDGALPGLEAAVDEVQQEAAALEAAGKWRPQQPGAVARIAEQLRSLRQPPSAPWPTSSGRGLFFVFEGLDRSGKSTHSRRLTEHLQSSRPARWICFPDRSTNLGALINLYLQKEATFSEKAIHLLFSANRWENADSIVASLNSGSHVVCDRYAFSGVAYSVANGLDPAFCQEPDRGLPAPDAVMFLRVDAQEASQREDYGLTRYEYVEMQAKVGDAFALPELRAGVVWREFESSRPADVNQADVRAAASEVADSWQEPLSDPPQQIE